jgi:hypothetical protein
VLAGGVDALSRAPLLYSDTMVRWFAGMMQMRHAWARRPGISSSCALALLLAR